MLTVFGPAGTAQSFYDNGYKNSLQIPEYLTNYGIDAFEYQCGRGVNIGEEKAVELGKLFAEKSITVSLHAPYYISMSSTEEEKRLKSIDYILASARAVDKMQGNRIVVHTGSCGKISRELALSFAVDTMKKAIKALDENGLSHISICPETMGKINQLGTLDEVIELCKVDERIVPCIDFGHLNARTLGMLKNKDDFKEIFEKLINSLGRERGTSFHSHFSKIEYTNGGEKCHLTFADTVFGPDYKPYIELLLEYGCNSTVICESAGTQTEDAATMRNYYCSLRKDNYGI